MSGTTLNSALLSLNQNLNHPGLLIDDRTEQQYMNFISGFSRLINFYNKSNCKDGSWEPFLLKDPVFLLANISQYDATNKSKLFKNSYTQCLHTADRVAENDLRCLNPLFNQIFNVFDDLLKWSTIMYEGQLSYSLKNDVIGEIEMAFATCFWAFSDLLNELSLSSNFTGIVNVDQGFNYQFETDLWSSVKNRKPYQKVLGLIKPLNETSLEDLVNCLKDNGIKVFQFYQRIVTKSDHAYHELSIQKTAYPDTLLLRTFFELLKVNQQDLNGLTDKHLAFYYDRVLKQLKRNAEADSVFICIDLAKPDSTFLLNKGIIFNAGVNAEKENITFESDKNYFLNTAKILSAYTLLLHASYPEELELSKKEPLALDLALPIMSLLLNENKDVGTLKKDENGTLLPWDTFGNANLVSNTVAPLAIAFASPMLLLKEGTRTIDLVFTFDQPTQAAILTTADFYLSTKSTWFSLKGKQTSLHHAKGLSETLHFTFELSATDPPIEKFDKNPDGYTENWPLIKIVYNALNDLSVPPMIKALDITTSVENLKSFVASNDNGALATAKPFMPFGPIVQRDSKMYIGNAEIFSKPLEFLSINISWDKLPQNFGVYYDLYNAYLGNVLLAAAPAKGADATTGKKTIRSRVAGLVGGLVKTVTKSNLITRALTSGAKWVFNRSKKVIENIEEKREEKKEQEANESGETKYMLGVFNNESFKVGFELLSHHNWSAITVDRELDCVFTDGVFECVAPDFGEETGAEAISLFNQNNDEGYTLNKKISFVYHKPEISAKTLSTEEAVSDSIPDTPVDELEVEAGLPYNPLLQNEEMLYSEKSAGGFIKLSLLDPLEGFGFDIYPQVISQVTLVNAANLINAAKAPPTAAVDPLEDAETDAASSDESPTDDAASTTAEGAAEVASGESGAVNVAAPLATAVAPVTGTAGVAPVTPADSLAATPSKAVPKAPVGPLPLPNPPFAPLISTLTASYQAKVSYTFHYQQETDPIQCYHYSVFNNYLVYDSTKPAEQYQNNISAELCGPKMLWPYLPMYANIDYNAVLYLEMENVIVGKDVSIFIELNQSANPVGNDQVKLEYFYLSNATWKPLEIVCDGSKELKCSGIITFEFPADMNQVNLQMNSANFWIAIGLKGNPDLIGKTSFLKTNGIKLNRAGMDYLDDTVSPALEPGKVVSTLAAIPEIDSIIQPFPSFGGRAAENDAQKNRRVANQLKTKGRPITINDFNRLVMQDFTSIFYSKVNYDKSSRTVSISLVKRIESEFASNAFLPMVSACEELEVKTVINDQTEIENLQVKNFEIEYVTVNATVYIQPEYDIKGASNRITQALKVFLSPWIDSSQKQVTIDQGVTDAQVASFITSFQEVSGIEDVSFQLAEYDNGKKGENSEAQNNVKPNDSATLLVPNMKHGIEWKKAV